MDFYFYFLLSPFVYHIMQDSRLLAKPSHCSLVTTFLFRCKHINATWRLSGHEVARSCTCFVDTLNIHNEWTKTWRGFNSLLLHRRKWYGALPVRGGAEKTSGREREWLSKQVDQRLTIKTVTVLHIEPFIVFCSFKKYTWCFVVIDISLTCSGASNSWQSLVQLISRDQQSLRAEGSRETLPPPETIHTWASSHPSKQR